MEQTGIEPDASMARKCPYLLDVGIYWIFHFQMPVKMTGY